MPMRYIKVPSPITIRDPNTAEIYAGRDGEPVAVSFGEFIRRASLNSDPRWSLSLDAIEAALAIEDAIAASDKTGVLQLAQEDWQKLQDMLANPRTQGERGQQPGYGGFQVSVLRQFRPFLRAVCKDSTEHPPRLEAANGEAPHAEAQA